MSALVEQILRQARLVPDAPAIHVEGKLYSYAELVEKASLVAATILESSKPATPVAVFGERKFWAYAAILGSLLAGRTYVPLGVSLPAERRDKVFDRSGARTIVAAGPDLSVLSNLLVRSSEPITLIHPDGDPPSLPAGAVAHRILGRPDLVNMPVPLPVRDPESPAYLLFTSGTTGEPKGIGIPHNRVEAYVRAARELFQVGPGDRCSQNFALTFDLSVHDLFVTWTAGACLFVTPPRSVLAPGKYVKEHQLTHWFSTPTTAALMQRVRQLSPGAFPSVRVSLFCGEALPVALAQAWSSAAPYSEVHNLYGPTEATIACLAHRFDPSQTPSVLGDGGTVPIGQGFGGTHTAIVDANLQPVVPGESGELLLGGDQLAPGYWNDPERTAVSFVECDDLEPPGVWYRTGDLVSLNLDCEPPSISFRGRLDDQIKVRGHRVELAEVETVLRSVSGTSAAVAIGWPKTELGADGIVAFIIGEGVDGEPVLELCRSLLPSYMVPTALHILDSLPQTASGKADRRQLVAMHEEEVQGV